MNALLKRVRKARRNDDGAVLIFALFIVTTIALVVPALLFRGDGSIKATVQLRSVAGSSYAADAAANIAVNDLRTGYGFTGNPNESGFNNSLDGVGCFGNNVGNNGTDKLLLSNFYPATGSQSAPTSAYIECTGVTGTGQQGSPVIINNSNKPGYAIVTLNGDLTLGDTSKLKDGALQVHGGIYLNGSVAGSGKVEVDAGDVRATGDCSKALITGTANKQCGSGVSAIGDPGYTDEITRLGTGVPAVQTPPTSCTNGVAKFTPGYYDNVATLNAASSMGCANTLWFQPGNYYFDFHNSSCGTYCPTSVFGSQSSNVWNIPRGTNVVGGTPVNSSGVPISAPSSNPTMPGSCQSPITDPKAVGVQFVFGNDSRMFLNGNGSSGAQMELCASYHSTRPPIEFFGLKSGTALSDTSPANNYGSSISTTAGTFANATQSSLQAPDGGNFASWTTSSANAQSAVVTDQGWAPNGPVPTGSILTGATLKITHKDADATNNSRGTAVLTVGSTSTSLYTLPAVTSNTTYTVPLSATDLGSLQKEVHDNGFTGAKVVYTANMKAKATATLDAITLDLTYAVPQLRGETGTCVATGTSCPLLSLDPSGNNKIIMYLQGTTYAPVADLNIVLSNFSAEVAKFGVVSRQLEFTVNTGNPGWSGPVFEIPDNSPGYGYANTSVDLKVHLCPAKPTCSASDTTALTSRVQLWDPSGSPAPPGRQISILSWNHNR